MIKNFFKFNPVHKKIVPQMDKFFLFNPILFFVVWVFICLGMYLNTYSPVYFFQETEMYIVDFNLKTLLLFLSISLLLSTFNTLSFDSQQNSELFPKLSKENFNIIFSEALSIKIHNLICFFCLALLFFIKFELMILGFFFYIFLSKIYYSKKIQFLFKDIICDLAYCILLILIGFIYSSNFIFQSILKLDFIILLLPYILFCLSLSIIKNIRSLTDVHKYNLKKIIFISMVFTIIGFVFSYNFNDPLASTMLIVCLPFFCYAFFRMENKDILRLKSYPIAIFNLFMMFIYPFLFISILIIFYISKYYYWHRFNVHYPTFLVDD